MLLPSVIIFDFDRTLTFLYQDVDLLVELKRRVLGCYEGLDIPDEVISRLPADGYLSWHRLHSWVAATHSDEAGELANERAQKLVADFEFSRAAVTPLLPGVVESIHSLYGHFRLGIVSSNDADALRIPLREAGIENLFQYIAGRPRSHFHPDLLKPSPSQLLEALRVLDADPLATMYVGDDLVDMVAADSAGVTPVGIASGNYSISELSRAGANMAFASLGEFSQAVLECYTKATP